MTELYTYDVNDSEFLTGTNREIFLNYLKIKIPSFAAYSDNKVWFREPELKTEYENFILNFSSKIATDEIELNYLQEFEIIKSKTNPTIKTNPPKKELLFFNTINNELFICIDNTIDKNIWKSILDGKIIAPIPAADKFDFFGDDKTISFYKFNNNIADVGGKYDGIGLITYNNGVSGNCITSIKNESVKINNLPFDTNTEAVTISSWIKWNGSNAVMPFGWETYDIFVYGGLFGFNTARGDVTGIDFLKYKNKWIYVSVTFRKNIIGKIAINGEEQELNKTKSTFGSNNAVMNKQLSIFGWNRSIGYRNFGEIDRLRIYDGELTSEQNMTQYLAEANLIK